MKITITQKSDVRNLWIVWGVVLLVVCLIGVFTGFSRTVTGAYAAGAHRWLGGENLYGEGIHGFLYLPQAAISYIPFAKLPHVMGEVLWRVVTILSFAGGVWYLTRCIKQLSKVEMFPIVSLVSLPLFFDSARNGQMTLLLAACMMMAVYELANERLWRVVLWCMLGLALKPLMLVVVLLIGALYPKTIWRLGAGVVGLAFVPVLFGGANYAIDQYVNFVHKADMASDSNLIEAYGYADFFGMLRCFSVNISQEIQTIVRIVFAAVTLVFCWLAKKRWGNVMGGVMVLGFSVVYLMLFNPRTELNTYSMLSVVLGVFAGGAFLCQRKLWTGVLLVLCMVFAAGSYEFTKMITPGRNVWLAPLVTTGFAAYLMYLVLANKKPIYSNSSECEKVEEKEIIFSSSS